MASRLILTWAYHPKWAMSRFVPGFWISLACITADKELETAGNLHGAYCQRMISENGGTGHPETADCVASQNCF
jgi:hypothetical protein